MLILLWIVVGFATLVCAVVGVAWGNTHATLVLVFPCFGVVAGFNFCCYHFTHWLLLSGHVL